MKEPSNLNIRYSFTTDIIYLRQWMKAPSVIQWFPITQENELEDALKCWMNFIRLNVSLTATIGTTPRGIATLFLMPYQKVAHQALFKIVVHPEYQKRGVGSSLIKNIKHLAKNYLNLELLAAEVFENNPLISLLKKESFYELFRQEKYAKIEGNYITRIYMESIL